MKEVKKEVLKNIFKERPKDSRKYDFGLLLVIGGSDFYSGSPALSALSAFRAGVDMVRVIAPKRAADIVASFTPDLASYPLPGSYLSQDDLPTLLSMTEAARVSSKGGEAVVIGGGMGRTETTQKVILDYLSRIEIPAVIDADGIHAVSLKPEIISGKPFLLTPHSHEFFVLTGKNIDKASLEEKITAVRDEAAKLKTVILLKGEVDIISDGKEVSLNRTGSPLMTKGGMGDTLAGISGAMLARGIGVYQSAEASAYINGIAGEIAIKKYGESVMTTDLINAISEALK